MSAGQLFDPSRIRPAAPAAQAPRTLTVSELNALIKVVLGDHLPGTIHLVGEISNCSRHTSGHFYLTLKDDRSEIRAVMWRSEAARVKFTPADGLEVVATGHVDLYESRGQYQFYIHRLEPRGTGALELAFRQLRERLERAGLFDPARKRPLPRFPRRIAVVTSATGAAVRDIIKTVQRRCPCVELLLHPVRVQGEGAAAEIAAAVHRLNRQAEALGGIDLLIVARGGGSLEDLWPFNEEAVARAIFDSRIPVISGVGHEVDVTIADLVADVRAPTPTAAAELAVPRVDQLLEALAAQGARLHRAVRHHLDLVRSRLDGAARLDWFRDPLAVVHRSEQRLDEVCSRLRLAAAYRVTAARRRLHRMEMSWAAVQPRVLGRQDQRLSEIAHRLRWALLQHLRGCDRRFALARQHLLLASPLRRTAAAGQHLANLEARLRLASQNHFKEVTGRLDGLEARLQATSHHRTLARGFTITRTHRGQIITSAKAVAPGERITTETADGSLESRVTDTRQGELFN